MSSEGSSSTPTWLPYAAIACTLVLWASAFVAIRDLGDDFSPGALSLGRLVVGSLALGVFALRRGRGHGLSRPTRAQWGPLVAIGVLWFGVYNLALNEGERRIDAGTASILVQVSPLLIAVLAALFLGEHFDRRLGLGLVIAFGGVALIAASSSGSQERDVLGVALVLVAAVVYAVSVILQKPLVASLPAVQVTWLACTVGAVVCLPFAPALVRESAAASGDSRWLLVYLGVFPTAVAFTTYAVALRHLDASRLGVSTYLVPPITIVLALVLLGEAPAPLAYAGGALTLVGVALSRGRRPSTTRRPVPAR